MTILKFSLVLSMLFLAMTSAAETELLKCQPGTENHNGPSQNTFPVVTDNPQIPNTVWRCVGIPFDSPGSQNFEGFDLEVDGPSLRSGYNELLTLTELQLDSTGKVLGTRHSAMGQEKKHRLGIVGNLAVKSRLYLFLNCDGENEGLPRGYIEIVPGRKFMLVRQDSHLKINFDVDCKRL